MAKTPSVKYLDSVWSDIIKKRAGYKCEYCGETKYLNSHHIFSRSNYTTRWDINNGVCLCAKHHVLGTFSAHKAPLEFAEWLRGKRGEDWYQSLKVRSKQAYSVNKKEMLETLNEYI